MSDSATTTLRGLWVSAVESSPSRPFLVFEAPDGSAVEWSYGEFDAAVDRVAARFARHGVGATSGVHLALTNTPSFVAAWLAAMKLGSFIVPSDPMATSNELADHMLRTHPAVGLCATTRSAVYRNAVAATRSTQHVADPSRQHAEWNGVFAVIEVDEASTEVLPGEPAAGRVASAPPGPLDRAAVMFTSGTTGRPKGVVITQANYAFAGTTMAVAADLGPNDRQLVVLPLFHANAQYYSFASAIAVGASVALMHTFSASGFLGQAARHGATHASLFAGPMRMILSRGGPLGDDVGVTPLRLRHCWFAQNLAADQYEKLADWFGCRPRQLYGMTETIPAVLTDAPDDPHCDSMGFVTSGCSVEIHDLAGCAVGPGVVGELVVGGRPGIELFGEYLDDPDTTAASFRDGWFLTGDRAWRDENGRFHFDGRRADVLKVSGENVSVVEVEATLSAHPGVLDVVVVGAPDPIRDEVPVAFVVPARRMTGAVQTHDSLIAELTAWSEAKLGKAKRPHRYVIVDELPRTSVGKIRKFMLAESAAISQHTPQHIAATDPLEVPS